MGHYAIDCDVLLVRCDPFAGPDAVSCSTRLQNAGTACVSVIPIDISPLLDVSLDDTITIVAQFAIYAYDAYMIACARTHSAPLVTIDYGLKVAAHTAGLTILEVTS
jgi:predicted nucleic acid-binding protein